MDIVKYERDNSFQRIKAWYIDESKIILTPDESERKDRLVHIWGLRINNKYSRHQAVKIITKDHNVSQATAYRDYTLSMQLFGEIDEVNVAAERMVLAENFWNLYQMALKKGNEDGAVKALKEYKSLFNFNDTEQKVDPKKLEASHYELKLPRGASKMLSKMFEDGIVDFNNITDEDVEWKEVEPDESVNSDSDD